MNAPVFDQLIPALVKGGVQFILVGGVAGVIHGAARLTYDVDIIYARLKVNYAKIVSVLEAYSPRLRDAPEGLPFHLDVPTLRNGLNFTLTTGLGDIDLLGEVSGGGTYESLLPHSVEVEAFGVVFRCVDLPKLIELKRAAGRPKDFEAIKELEAILKRNL